MPPRFNFPPKVSLRLSGLNSYPSYDVFLKEFAKYPANKKIVPTLEKCTLDREYENLLRKKYPHDESVVRRHLNLSRARDACSAWDEMKSRQAGTPTAYLSSVEVTNLTLPSLVRDRFGEDTKFSKDKWGRQSYQAFADKLAKQNPRIPFTKQLADDALRFAVSKLAVATSKGLPASEIEKMLKRCLGKESDEYWQKRSDS
ncbi:hypothetical protein LTR97_001031 [Elasticomyces elasticus]|uniref:Uncharacterized protein n=1 Tax=Elasticomyces elasticus TaxID=574655 RepID=A0AAN7ZVR7_9PEZI|nr:hypothetical protein LTR97_001031 [Elasticomyces elasticus]